MKKIVFLLVLFSIAGLNVFARSQSATPESKPAAPAVEKPAAPVVEDVKNNVTDPVTDLREQIEAAPNASERIRLQLKLADLLAANGHKSQAVAELNAIAKSDSFDPAGFYNLGNSFARLGEAEAAINAYRTAIDQRKGRYSRAYNNLGVLLLRSGRWDEAQDALLSALKLESFRYAEASYNLGRVYSARGLRDLAAREWRRALLVDPEHDAAAYALSHVATEDNIVIESAPAAAPVAKPDRKTSSAAPAASYGSKPLALDRVSFDYMQRARSASERGKMSEAAENYRRVLSRQGGYFPPANLELSYALLGLRRQDEAMTQLLEVSQRDGARYPISYFHLARLYELKGELKLAEAAFTKAAAAYATTNAQFLLDVSRVREKLGDFKGALEAMEQYLKLMPEQGQKPVGADQRIAELRRKAGQ